MIYDKVALRYFDLDKDGRLNEKELHERNRIASMNRLPLDEFLKLSEDDRHAAEDLWAAKIIEANGKRRLR